MSYQFFHTNSFVDLKKVKNTPNFSTKQHLMQACLTSILCALYCGALL